jgi:L-aminopeptidase/D-esterase-like protein
LYPYEGRRKKPYGSVIVVIATDAPLMTSQLNRLAKRAALGLGRVGSHAASTSGEIIMAFSTGNQISREKKERSRLLHLTSVNDTHINPLYEAVIEATEESVINAMFCSPGQTGRLGRSAPPIPVEKVLDLLE